MMAPCGNCDTPKAQATVIFRNVGEKGYNVWCPKCFCVEMLQRMVDGPMLPAMVSWE